MTKLLNPRLTLQNAEEPDWLANVEHTFNDSEHISFTVLVPKAENRTVAAATQTAVLRAKKLLDQLAQHTPPG